LAGKSAGRTIFFVSGQFSQDTGKFRFLIGPISIVLALVCAPANTLVVFEKGWPFTGGIITLRPSMAGPNDILAAAALVAVMC